MLREIPWSTPAVMATTRAAAGRAGYVIRELSEGHDIDEFEDLAGALVDARAALPLAARTARAIASLLDCPPAVD